MLLQKEENTSNKEQRCPHCSQPTIYRTTLVKQSKEPRILHEFITVLDMKSNMSWMISYLINYVNIIKHNASNDYLLQRYILTSMPSCSLDKNIILPSMASRATSFHDNLIFIHFSSYFFVLFDSNHIYYQRNIFNLFYIWTCYVALYSSDHFIEETADKH